ncbi:MAG TPA: hypothetical protein VK045_02220 [Ornithinicoccus sp.]|nr:hypothetical protein [Ornithinicoccus sp.]
MVHGRFPLLLVGLTALITAFGLTLAATGPGASHQHGEVGTAVRTLVSADGAAALDRVPDGFASVMGYAPVLEDGHLVRPDGGCSSPVSLPAGFEAACRQHDYGYDLLRYAERTGSPLGRWARGQIDDLLATRLVDSCVGSADSGQTPGGGHSLTDEACLASAQLAVGGVELNSLRQGDGVPEESARTGAALASSVLGLVGLVGAAVRRP